MRRTHNDDGIADCVCLLSRNEERGINQMMRFQRARDLCCRFSLRGGKPETSNLGLHLIP